MTHKEAAEAVAAWVREASAELSAGPGWPITVSRSYPFPIDIRQAEPPNVTAITNRVFTANSDERFPARRLGQRLLRVFEMAGSVAIDPGSTDESARNRHEELEKIGDLLEKDISNGDTTLRGNLPAGVQAARTAVFDYSDAFVELEDRSRFRIVAYEIALAELVEP